MKFTDLKFASILGMILNSLQSNHDSQWGKASKQIGSWMHLFLRCDRLCFFLYSPVFPRVAQRITVRYQQLPYWINSILCILYIRYIYIYTCHLSHSGLLGKIPLLNQKLGRSVKLRWLRDSGIRLVWSPFLLANLGTMWCPRLIAKLVYNSNNYGLWYL